MDQSDEEGGQRRPAEASSYDRSNVREDTTAHDGPSPVAAVSAPIGPASLQSTASGDPAYDGDVSNLVTASAMEEVRLAAEKVATGGPLESALTLDAIWKRNIDRIDLSEYVKAHSTTISFPEKLMLLLIHIERNQIKSGKRQDKTSISWTLEGRAIVIRQREQLLRNWLPMFFRQGKFESFTRKLYRWGFRQVNLPKDSPQGKSKELIFANPHFQRDRRDLMRHMRSVTAAGMRRQQQGGPVREQTRPKVSLANTTPASDAIIRLPPSIEQQQQQIPAPSSAPSADPFASMFAQQNQLGVLDALARQAFPHQQIQQYGPALTALLNQQQQLLNPQHQQQHQLALLSSILSASQSSLTNTMIPQAPHPPQVPPQTSFSTQPQNYLYPFANLFMRPSTERGGEGLFAAEQKTAENDADALERLQRAAELLLRAGQDQSRNNGMAGNQGPPPAPT